MDKTIWPRVGAACGVLYVALILIGNSVYESGNEAVGLPMEIAGMLLFVPFLGYLFGILRRAEGEGGWLSATAFGAGLMGITVKFASLAPVLAMGEIQAGTPLYRALEIMTGTSFNLSIFPFAVLAAAFAVVILKTQVLPAWLGWMGAVTAPVLLANAMFFFAEFIPAFLLFLLWIILTSAVLTWRAGAPRPVEASRPSGEPAGVR